MRALLSALRARLLALELLLQEGQPAEERGSSSVPRPRSFTQARSRGTAANTSVQHTHTTNTFWHNIHLHVVAILVATLALGIVIGKLLW